MSEEEKIRNDICRRCEHLKEKKVDGSIFPIYYCKEYPNGLDAEFMNTNRKDCFSKKVTGPWRMPYGTFDEKTFTAKVIFRDDEWWKKKGERGLFDFDL